MKMNKMVSSEKWLSLYPSINTTEQLDVFLKRISGLNLSEWVNRYNKFEHSSDEFITREFKAKKLNRNWESISDWDFLFLPVCQNKLDEFEKIIKEIKLDLNSKKLMEELRNTLISNCLNMSFRIIINEINYLSENNLLKGDDEEQRYSYFVNTLIKDSNYQESFYKKYPVMYKTLSSVVENTTNYIEEILTNLDNDWDIISSEFNPRYKKLENIQLSLGDTHSHGKTVCTLFFDDGYKLIYKPRRMQLDVKLDKFEKELANVCNLDNIFYLPKTISIEDHGYAEFIEGIDCDSLEDVKMFYIRMGRTLAVLYLMNSKDYHGENILASNGKPYLIDNETIIHESSPTPAKGYQAVAKAIDDSVYSIGALPFSLYSSVNEKGMEVGALNSGEKLVSPYKTQEIINKRSDKVTTDWVYKEIGQMPSSPKYNSKYQSCSDFFAELITGFSEVYVAIMNNKEEVLTLIYDYFIGEKVRYIYRNTNQYTQLLETANHPELQVNQCDKELYLLRIFDNNEECTMFDLNINHEEYSDLKDGDVPMFMQGIADGWIYNYKDKPLAQNPEPSLLEQVTEKLKSFSIDDLNRQIRIIRMTYIGQNLYHEEEKRKSVDEVKINELIASRIKDSAIHWNDKSGWITLSGINNDYYTIEASQYDLYNSGLGVALALAIDDSALNKRIVFEALDYCKEFIHDLEGNISLGAFNGVSGYLYVLSQLSFIYPELEVVFLDECKQYLPYLENELSRTNELDMISGVAGVLSIMTTFLSTYDKSFELYSYFEKIAEICYLQINKAVKIDNGKIYWIEGDAGFAHGDYGVLTALARYVSYCGKESIQFKQTELLIKTYLEYERINYRDNLSYNIRDNAKVNSWCNGLNGILLAKKIIIDCNLADSKEKEVVNQLYEMLIQKVEAEDASICHGSLGNLAILHRVRPDEKNKQYSHNLVKDELEKRLANDIEDWGLMCGEAGMLLALSDKGLEKVSQLLILGEVV